MAAPTPDIVTHYTRAFEAFENGLNGQAQSSLHQVRRDAIEQFADMGFPTSRDEAWKATDLGPITATTFEPQTRGAQIAGAETVGAYTFGMQGPTLVFVNGHYAQALSSVPEVDGVTIGPLDENAEALLAGLAEDDRHALAALNTAFFLDGAYVHIQKDVVFDEPVHVLNLTQTGAVAHLANPRTVVIAEPGSRVTIVETYVGQGQGAYLNNAVTEIHVGENARVDHVKTTLEGFEGRHTAYLRIVQDRASRFTSHTFSIDGAFTRNDIKAVLAGEGCESTVNGFYILNNTQYCDHYTLLEHQQPHCPSHELFKGILGDTSRAVFRGKIHVHRAAQKTDAYQQNQNILLSDRARVNTKPQLEIYADDVKCSHGATIGQLDTDALFYLRARGISPDAATRILLHAFAGDILDRIEVEPLRDALTERILAKIDRYGAAS